MSRSANALIALGFGYARYGVAMISGLLVLPLILAWVDHALYSRWLVVIELLSYLGFAELGVATVLPWLVAQRDGQSDRVALRALIADARGCCLLSIGAYLAVFAALTTWAPSWIGLDGGIRSSLGFSVTAVAICTAISFFGRIHLSILDGLQDYLFLGSLALAQSISGVLVTIVLLLFRMGTLALACGLLVPALLGSSLAVWRVWRRNPDLVAGLPWPSRDGMLHLAFDAGGTWLGGVGGRLTLSSNALLLALAGGTPADIICFSCTAKLGEMLMAQSWQVIDSGLVGLAQLQGEGRRERVREIAGLMTRLALIGSGAVMLVILGLNRGFVAVWLGPDKFGGIGLNAAMAGTLLGLSLAHVLSVTAAAIGFRVAVGATNLIHGACYAVAAIGLGLLWGPIGVAFAGCLSALCIGVPLLSRLQTLAAGVKWTDVLNDATLSWLPRAALPITLAAVFGASEAGQHVEVAAPITVGLGLAYLWLMRPLLSDVPLPKRVALWSRKLRLFPEGAR